MAHKTTVNSGFELVTQLEEWSELNMRQETVFCIIDVVDLYTMIPQVEGVLSLKKMLDHLKLKQVGGLKVETIIRLSRFVMKNYYFSYNDQYYHQIRGGAMDSPLNLTMANCYMFFFEQDIVKQIQNSGGFYRRYIDDIFLTVNWPVQYLLKQIHRWNTFDSNIKLTADISHTTHFLDLHILNIDGKLCTTIFHKPSYEPYYLPFNSIHPLHIKKNITFTMLLRAIRYCSTFELYLKEREILRISLLFNRYPNDFIEKQFSRLLEKYNINSTLINNQNYGTIRKKVIDTPEREKLQINYNETMFIHLTYCSSMKMFPTKFQTLWQKYFNESPIDNIQPILGIRNVNNLHRQMIHTR